jgi:hypothetical protein
MITIYDNKGKIVVSAQCSEDAKQVFLSDPAYKDFAHLDQVYDPQKYYIDPATATPVEIPARPDFNYFFSYDTYTWEININTAIVRAKNQRNILLAETDWTDTLSAKPRMGDELYNQWQTYRQALRDVPEQAGFPLAIVWPTPPE